MLPLGRVVSTKVYLSSRGRDESVRQHAATWRQKFLQQGMQGTAIVFGNGNVGEAMKSFPPEDDVLRDTFVAVFTRPEKPTAQEQEVMQGCSEDAVRKQTAMAQTALRKEVELEVDKVLFDKQARRLMDTSYVYHECATYRSDLVDALPPGRAVPRASWQPPRSCQRDRISRTARGRAGPRPLRRRHSWNGTPPRKRSHSTRRGTGCRC